MARACSMGSLFGEGVYFAECIEKADQYAGDADREHNECGIDRHGNPYNLEGLHSLLYPQPEDHPGNVSYALVCRVALGYSIRTQVGVRAYYCAPRVGLLARAPAISSRAVAGPGPRRRWAISEAMLCHGR
jgi:hypothetical protein